MSSITKRPRLPPITSPTATPKREATERRRREILDAALRCFLEKGVRDTSIEQIRKAAGASTGSIYHLFAGKDEIAFTLFVEGMRGYRSWVMAAVASRRTARGVIQSIIDTHLRFTVEQPELCSYLTQMGMADGDGDITAEYRASNEEYVQKMFAFLKPYIEAREIVSLPPEMYLSLIVGPATHLCRAWLRGRYPADPLAAADMLAEAAWRSLQWH